MQLSLAERDAQVIWHPYTPQKNAAAVIGIVRGEGVYLVDEEDNRYIDAISSWWVTLHGHAHPYIAHKLSVQAGILEQVIFAGFTHLPAIQLAEKLLPLIPGKFARIFYSDNGSTATEVAIKMALQYWWNKGEKKRTKVLAVKGAYHGDTFGAMSASARGIFTNPFLEKLFEVTFLSLDEPLDTETISRHIANNEIACLIYEPLVQGAAGMKMHSATQLERLLAIIQSAGVLCIADEVMTGFGRTGTLFASEQCSSKPDIICLSKGLTGGTLAMGITACTEKIYEAYLTDNKEETFFHGHSFTANPLACTAALASLELLMEPACQSAIRQITLKHVRFLEWLNDEGRKYVKNARQTGTILAFEIMGDEDGYLNTIGTKVTALALQKGVYLRPLGNTLYILPPYCITMEELERVYQVIREILSEIQEAK